MKYFPVVALLACSTTVFAAKPMPDAHVRVPARAITQQAMMGRLSAHPVVALTFDDLPAAGSLPPGEDRVHILTALAAELKVNHLEGTYGFVLGSDLQDDEDAQEGLKAWLGAGMNIGSHTWSHPSLEETTAEAFERDIAKDEPVVRRYAQVRDWRWFRYPYLLEGETRDKRQAVLRFLAARHYRVAHVTLDFEDDAWNDAYARCMERQDEGAIQWLRQSYIENAEEYIRVGREEQLIAFGREIPNVMLLHATAFTTMMFPELMNLLRGQGFTFDGLANVEMDPVYRHLPEGGFKDVGMMTNRYIEARGLKYPPMKPMPMEQLDGLCK